MVPPEGYLERLRDICTQNEILLIIGEVGTGIVRVGEAFASERFGVRPDLMFLVKRLAEWHHSHGRRISIHDACLHSPDYGIDFYHGYTGSGHPVACGAAMATLKIFEVENLYTRPKSLQTAWLEHFQVPGFMLAVEHQPREGEIGASGIEFLEPAFGENRVDTRDWRYSGSITNANSRFGIDRCTVFDPEIRY